jgi:hypothetical protein
MMERIRIAGPPNYWARQETMGLIGPAGYVALVTMIPAGRPALAEKA